MSGINPAAIGQTVRLHFNARESAATKSARLLVSGRVQLRRLDSRGLLAHVKGDSGRVRTVIFDSFADSWSCDCESRGKCSHLRAVMSVVAVEVPS